jgi:hypothetical protein
MNAKTKNTLVLIGGVAAAVVIVLVIGVIAISTSGSAGSTETGSTTGGTLAWSTGTTTQAEQNAGTQGEAQTADASAGSCTIYAYGNDARVYLTGPDDQAECTQFIQAFSAGGDYWDEIYSFPSEPPLETVCVLYSGNDMAVVRDDGGQDIGQQVCSDLVSSGWVEQQ